MMDASIGGKLFAPLALRRTIFRDLRLADHRGYDEREAHAIGQEHKRERQQAQRTEAEWIVLKPSGLHRSASDRSVTNKAGATPLIKGELNLAENQCQASAQPAAAANRRASVILIEPQTRKTLRKFANLRAQAVTALRNSDRGGSTFRRGLGRHF
jgi:hypothetical protein